MKLRPPELSEEQLVCQVSIKSRLGAEVLYSRYSANLCGVIVQIVKNTGTAEDILQQVFIKIWDSIESYDASKGRLFTWMLTITRNAAKDMLRSKQHRQEGDTINIEGHISQIDRILYVVFNNDVLCIKNLVTRLKKDQRDIIDLLYFKGYTQTEAAEELGIPLGTVKARCRMALHLLCILFKPPDVVTIRKYA